MIRKGQRSLHNHRILEETHRLNEPEIDDRVARGDLIEEDNRIQPVLMIERVGFLRPYITCLADIITEDIHDGIPGLGERIHKEMIGQDILAGTALGTEVDYEMTSLNREIKGRLDLVGPVRVASRQPLDTPLVMLYMVVLGNECIFGDVVDLLHPRGRSVELDLIDIIAARADDLRFVHDRDRIGSQSRCIEGEEAGTILDEHTIHYIETIVLHTSHELLVAPQDILLGEGTVGTTVALIIGVRPAVHKSVRRHEIRVDLTALHILELTIGARQSEIGITEVSSQCTVMGSQTRRDRSTLRSVFLEVDTYGSPLLPHDRRGVGVILRGIYMPSLLSSSGLELASRPYIETGEVRLTTGADSLIIHQEIQFEARILGRPMSRSLQDRKVFEEQDRMLDRIDLEGELDTLRLVTALPVTETHRRELALRNGFCQTAGTRICLLSVKMHYVAALTIRRTKIYRWNNAEIIKRLRIRRRRVIDIANRIRERQIIHAHLIGIIDEFGLNRLEAIVILIALRANDDIRLAGSEIGESSTIPLYDLRSCP